MAYTHYFLKNKLYLSIDLLLKQLKQESLSGTQYNYKDGVKCEDFVAKRLKKRNKKFIIGQTKGSKSKIDLVVLENKRQGVILHAIQVKSSVISKNDIKQLDSNVKIETIEDCKKLTNIINRLGVCVLSVNIWYVGVFNKIKKEVVLTDLIIGEDSYFYKYLKDN